jgi:hypothetical protein
MEVWTKIKKEAGNLGGPGFKIQPAMIRERSKSNVQKYLLNLQIVFEKNIYLSP